MTTGHLVTNRNLTFLSNINTYCLIYTRRQLIAVLSCKYFGIYNNTIFSVRNLKGSITNFSCFLTKDCTKKTLFCCQFCLSLRSNFTNEDITGTNLCTDTDDTTLIQILECIIANTRNVSGDLFRSQLGVTGLCLILLDMNGSIYILLHQTLT